MAVAAIAVPFIIPIFRSSQPGSDLRAEDVEIALASSIDATVQNPAEPPLHTKTIGSAIDVTLRNSGAAPALIVSAVLSFTRDTELDNCAGAGPGSATAEYDVKVPDGKAVTANDPLVLRRDMRFIVGANSVDRFRISVGPVRYSLSSWPWIYEFNLTLLEDNGQKIDLGPMSMLGLPGQSWNELRGLTADDVVLSQQMPCVTRDASELSQAMTSPGLHSPELQTMYREAESLRKGARPCQSIPISENPNGCPATGPTFFSDPRGVTACSATIQVVQSYNCSAAEDIARQYEEAYGSAQEAVFMTYSSSLSVLPMRCLPAGRAEVCRSTDEQDLTVGFLP